MEGQINLIYDPKKIFVVHGHDSGSKNELASFLYRLGLVPIVLNEQPKEGRTIIEQFEKHALNVGYAMILLTPDDIGYGDEHSMKPRVRQNVILEMGYFWGKLGRGRVCCLAKGDVEPPSDMHGILLIKYNNNLEERFYNIEEELRKAGYKIGTNQ